MVQPLWKALRRCLKKLKIELPYDPAILLLSIYPEKPKNGFPGGTVVENLPASAGDMGSSAGLGRSYMPRSD